MLARNMENPGTSGSTMFVNTFARNLGRPIHF